MQEFTRYDQKLDVPLIDVHNSSDQKFMWVIPVEPDNNNFSLKPFNESYYSLIACRPTNGTFKAAVHEQEEGDPLNLRSY